MLALQVISFFVFVYLDSIMLTTGVIAYFMEEWFSSSSAWLSCVLIVFLVYLEWGLLKLIRLAQN